jgi:hypothetical protein
VSSQTTAVFIKGPSIGAILSVLGDAAPNEGGLEQGASVELAGGAGALLVQDVSKSSGMDVTTVIVTLTTGVAQAVIIEWFKNRLAARRPPAPDKPSASITVIVGDVHVSSG